MTASLAKLRQVAIAAASACGMHAEAEDIAQDAMEAYVRTPPATDGSSWAYTVARNRAVDVIRHRRIAERTLAALCPPQPPGPEVTALDAVERDQLRAAVAMLPERQRQVISYRLLGYPETQIAGLMGISGGAVKAHRHRAVAALREALEGSR